jgi:hypothetical protein
MGMTWFPMAIQPHVGYRPRHRSTRRNGTGAELDRRDRIDAAGQWERPANAIVYAGPPAAIGQFSYLRSFDGLTSDEIRHVLEGCALDELSQVVPGLVHLIAHSSHTPASLTVAWTEFEAATRDAYALHLNMRAWSDFFRQDQLGPNPSEHAVAIKLSHADEAWQLITRGLVTRAIGSARHPRYR